jgi:protein-L-isoaspartate(D-aspartate) O-methyltransferase
MADSHTKARARMVETQIAGRGIRDARVLDAMRSVPRHIFVPREKQAYAYDDRPLEVGFAQTISQPYMVGVMTELLGLSPEDRVLEIGTGSGYQCAVLASLASEVVSVERVERLAESARATLDELEYDNVTVVVGDGTLGCPEQAPFNAILVTAGAPYVPRALERQLADGGRLLCPAGDRSMQRLIKIVRRGDELVESEHTRCVFVPLIGENGWEA